MLCSSKCLRCRQRPYRLELKYCKYAAMKYKLGYRKCSPIIPNNTVRISGERRNWKMAFGIYFERKLHRDLTGQRDCVLTLICKSRISVEYFIAFQYDFFVIRDWKLCIVGRLVIIMSRQLVICQTVLYLKSKIDKVYFVCHRLL